jgi:hypothetical protein
VYLVCVSIYLIIGKRGFFLQLGIEHAIKLAPDGLEELGAPDAVDEIIRLALVLHDAAGLVRQNTDLLVGLLSGLSLRAQAHDDGLGDHERQLRLHVSGDTLGVDDQAVGDVVETNQDGVRQEEGFGDVDTADGGVVECAFHWYS